MNILVNTPDALLVSLTVIYFLLFSFKTLLFVINQEFGARVRKKSLILNKRKVKKWNDKNKMQVIGRFPLLFNNLYSYSLDLFEIRKLSSVFLQVKTHIGLQILYDREGLRLYLQADGRWKDDTVGLCGTFNGNMEDDFLYEYMNIYNYNGESAVLS